MISPSFGRLWLVNTWGLSYERTRVSNTEALFINVIHVVWQVVDGEPPLTRGGFPLVN